MMKLSIRVILAVVLLSITVHSGAAEPDYLPYPEFIAAVDTGSVKSVSLDRLSRINGTRLVDGVERPFQTYGATGSANDVLLTRLLKEKGVATTLNDQKERPPFEGAFLVSGLFMVLIPLITVILAFRINSKLDRLSRERNA